MKCNGPDDTLIYQRLLSEIDKVREKTVPLSRLLYAIESLNDDMPAFLQSPGGQAVFSSAVMQLVHSQILIPVGNKPHTHHGLHQKYRIRQKPDLKDPRLQTQIIKSIESPASLDYYLKNPDDFLKDRVIIETIGNFLKQKDQSLVTVNERAYQLFGDEKFFKGDDQNRSRGKMILTRLGLDYSNLGCEDTTEPFFSFCGKEFYSCQQRQIYIIENRDTFWSFKKNIMDLPSRIRTDMLIYGEGKKIISSFKFVTEYELDSERDTFFYFGDLDIEGINIYSDLKDKYPQYRISPFKEGYLSIFEIGCRREPVKTPKQQKVNQENMNGFIREFEPSVGVKLKTYLDEGFYIPQEALSATEMKERFGKKYHDGTQAPGILR